MDNRPSFKQRIIFFGIIAAIVLITVVVGNFIENKKWRNGLKAFFSIQDKNTASPDSGADLPGNNLSLTRDNSGAESPTGVYPDKKEYEQGEQVAGAIRNSEDFDIIVTNIAIERLSVGECDKSMGNIDAKDCVQKEWKTAKYDIGCRGCAAGITSVKCERVNIKVLSRSIYKFNWNQSTDEVGASVDTSKEDEKPACLMAGDGTYRVKVSYYEDPKLPPGAVSEQTVKQEMYSEEFIINDINKQGRP